MSEILNAIEAQQLTTPEALIGKTIAAVETSEFYGYGPITVHFTDGTWVCFHVKRGWESCDVGVEIAAD